MDTTSTFPFLPLALLLPFVLFEFLFEKIQERSAGGPHPGVGAGAGRLLWVCVCVFLSCVCVFISPLFILSLFSCFSVLS